MCHSNSLRSRETEAKTIFAVVCSTIWVIQQMVANDKKNNFFGLKNVNASKMHYVKSFYKHNPVKKFNLTLIIYLFYFKLLS